MAGDHVEEPDDLYRVRVAAHELATKAYRYLRFADTLADGGNDPEFEQLKGTKLDGPGKTGGEYLEADLDGDPKLRLEFTVRSLTMHVDELMTAHGEFQETLKPLESELASIYPGLVSISGFECRSHCKALESFAWNMVRWTLDTIARNTPDSEFDDTVPADFQPFTATNWHPVCVSIVDRFSESDIEDRVHEAIEQEVDDAWEIRLSVDAPVSPVKAGRPDRTRRILEQQEALESLPGWCDERIDQLIPLIGAAFLGPKLNLPHESIVELVKRMVLAGHGNLASAISTSRSTPTSPQDAIAILSRIRDAIDSVIVKSSVSEHPPPPAAELQKQPQQPDGPSPPNVLRFNGQAIELETLPWRLVEYMWNCESAPFDDAVQHVWGDPQHVVAENALASAITKANRGLSQIAVPWKLGRKSGHVVKKVAKR